MCGITGIIAFSEEGKQYLPKIGEAVNAIVHRGPDGHATFADRNVALGHARLAIIDTSTAAAQPFQSADHRYTIVFNGEIFNYRELRSELEQDGVTFRTSSDTEVLLNLFARDGKEMLPKLNGFFAFAIYDRDTETTFVARDRYGEKPLYIRRDQHSAVFASEPAGIWAVIPEQEINQESISDFLHLNYVATGSALVNDVTRMPAGTWIEFYSGDNDDTYNGDRWYTIPGTSENPPSYNKAIAEVRKRLEKAVERRMIADVPLGSFLSGGIDSSVVASLAIKKNPDLHTFSIGFPDEPHFDETRYAEMVAKQIGSKHHVFQVRNNDLLEALHDFLNRIDMPFADSSALAVHILSRETRKHVTVALSGDGADELFAGYNKHSAEYIARNPGLIKLIARAGRPLWDRLPGSRNSKSGNFVRQMKKFSKGVKLTATDRWWEWAGYYSLKEMQDLLLNKDEIYWGGENLDDDYVDSEDFNSVLRADFNIVLEGDMLIKADTMSMRHGLEMRSPFLDHELVEYVMQLPADYKIDRKHRKKILKDATADLLPSEIFTRRKQGFEVPLLQWFRNDLQGLTDELLGIPFLKQQQLFHPKAIAQLRKQLMSNNPGDSASRLWGLIVFQSWWKKYYAKNI
jgi:asparagine synthase (glutamine-hydrolysing)